VSKLGGCDESLTLAVERLERLHEVRERADVRLRVDRLVDGQDLLELVLLLTYRHRHSPSRYVNLQRQHWPL